MFKLQLTPEQMEFRDTVREFVRDTVKPSVLDPARLQELPLLFPFDVLEQASSLGLRLLRLSEEVGGAGADALTSCMVLEELGAGDVGVAYTIGETARLAHVLFDLAMTPVQRDRFMPRFLVDPAFHLAVVDRLPGSDRGLAYYRPGELSEPLALTATRQGEDWLLNGSADFVLNAPLAGLFAVCVDQVPGTDGGAGFLLPADAAGLEIAAYEAGDGEMPWYHGLRGRLTLSNCRVHKDMVLTAQGHAALRAAQPRGGNQDPWQVAINLGLGRAACEAALEYANVRVQGARPIVGHQALGIKFADMAMRIEVARTMVWRAACAVDQGGENAQTLPLCAIARVYTSEAMHEVTELAAECFGAMGVMRDMPMQKYFNEATVLLDSGCSNSASRFRIAEAYVGYEGRR